MKIIISLAKNAKAASVETSQLSTAFKNRLLLQIARHLARATPQILRANAKDIAAAKAKKVSAAFVDRLTLTPKRIQEMVRSLKAVAKLPDPVGRVVAAWKTPAGLRVKKIRIPLGVIGIIYESRPDVTVDTAALCLKAGNAVILRGGSEAFHSNKILCGLVRAALKKSGANPNIVQRVPDTSHQAVAALLKQDSYVDLIIPRGGASLMKMVRKLSKIPVVRHDKGVCHVFVDREADLKMAQKICLNAKVQRPSTCNAMETLLVDQKIAPKFLPPLMREYRRLGVQVRRGKKSWGVEYLDKILGLRVVKNLEEAIRHIQKYGSLHTEAIVTRNKNRAAKFLREVLASVVLVNASTRLNDGFQLGLGAEVGISTTKLHAFGPMGLEELTTMKFAVTGLGQIRR